MLDTNHTVEVPEGIEIRLPLAGPIERSLAFLLDLLIRAGIYLIAGTVLSVMGRVGGGFMLIAVFLLEWFYPVLFEVLNQGATPGKKLMGIAVVNDDGTPVNWSSSFVRNLLRTADMFPAFYLVGILSMLLNSQFKRLGDLAAGTLVVHRKAFTNPGTLPKVKPQHSPVALTLEEQSAILHFGERSNSLSEARSHELAEHLKHVIDGSDAKHRMTTLLAIANWLRGRR